MRKTITGLSFLAAVLLVAGAGCFSLSNDEQEFKTTGPAGMFVSVDKGEKQWQSISLLPQADGVQSISGVSVYRVFDDPQDPNAMYWASRGQGLYYAYDEGKTWRRAVEPLHAGFIYGAAVHPKDKCQIFATNGMFVYKTKDCGRYWEEVYREDRGEARISSLLIEAAGGNAVFLSKINGDILSSSDDGESWTVRDRLGVRVEQLAADTQAPNVFYAATRDDGLYRSENSGASWTSLLEGLKQFPGATSYRRLFTHPAKANTVYWISTYGILVSTDRGNTWTAMKLITSPGSVDIFGFAVNPKNDKEIYYTATLQSKSTFYKTSDGGATWSTKKLPSGQIPTVIRVHPVKDNIIYVGFTNPAQG